MRPQLQGNTASVSSRRVAAARLQIFFFFSGGLHGPLVDRNTIRAFAFHIAAALFHSVAPLANCAGLSFYINPPLPFVDLLFSIEDYK